MQISKAISACGLDFGTSNSTLAFCQKDKPQLALLENGSTTVPSAVFFGQEVDDRFLIGRTAVNAYVDGATGRLMRSLKSILGSNLLAEQTPVFKNKISFAEIVGKYLQELKSRAEFSVQSDLSDVVMGRPVQFVDNDEAANALAEKNLGKIAKSIGFKNISFQFEPVAAALEFERQLTTEKLALIADIGGGTSDFSILRLGGNTKSTDRKNDVLANAGLRVGGTDFDCCLSMSNFMPSFGYRSANKNNKLEMPIGPFWDLSTWSSVHNLYEPKFMSLLKALRFDAQNPHLIERFMNIVSERRCHSLLMAVEQVKMGLSKAATENADLDWVEKQLNLVITRESFERSTKILFDKIQKTVLKCLKNAGISADQVDVLFFTGGTSAIPAVREAVMQNFPNIDVVDGDQFGAVGMGLGIEAHNRYA